MGKRGPAPKPTKLKLLQGTYRADRAARNEPMPIPDAPSCPTWLGREAKREWKRVTDDLAALGMLTQLDRTMLAAYCQAYHEWWEAEKEIKANGRVQVTDTGYEALRPIVSVRNKALARVEKFGAKFGLSPSDRTRISVPEKKEQEADDPWSKVGS